MLCNLTRYESPRNLVIVVHSQWCVIGVGFSLLGNLDTCHTAAQGPQMEA